MKVRVLCDVAVSPNLRNRSTPCCCAYPLTTVSRQGTLICVYRCGREKHSYDGVWVSGRSEDCGHTWSKPTTICDLTQRNPPQSVSSGGVCRTSDGSLLTLFKTTEVSTPDHHVHSKEAVTQRCLFFTSSSDDDGLSWSTLRPVKLNWEHQIGVPAKPLLLRDGQLMIPLEAIRRQGQTTLIGFSADNGRTIGGLDEAGLSSHDRDLECTDARFTLIGTDILALLWTFRTCDEQTVQVHRAVSHDRGRTWSRPVPAGFLGQVTAPVAINDDIVIAASNYRLAREGIRMWLSGDRGVTWQYPPIQMWDPRQHRVVAQPLAAPLEAPQEAQTNEGVWRALPGFTFGTPDLVVLPDDTIVLTYYATVNQVTHIRACHFGLILDGMTRT